MEKFQIWDENFDPIADNADAVADNVAGVADVLGEMIEALDPRCPEKFVEEQCIRFRGHLGMHWTGTRPTDIEWEWSR